MARLVGNGQPTPWEAATAGERVRPAGGRAIADIALRRGRASVRRGTSESNQKGAAEGEEGGRRLALRKFGRVPECRGKILHVPGVLVIGREKRDRREGERKVSK